MGKAKLQFAFPLAGKRAKVSGGYLRLESFQQCGKELRDGGRFHDFTQNVNEMLY